MNFNEAQRAVLRDYDEGKHAHLIEAHPRSEAVVAIKDPLLHFLLNHSSDHPCEIASSIAASASIQLEIITQQHTRMRHVPQNQTKTGDDGASSIPAH